MPTARISGCTERGSSCNGTYTQREPDQLWEQDEGDAVIYFDGSCWKVNDHASRMGWYYLSDSSSLFEGTWTPAAGAGGQITVEAVTSSSSSPQAPAAPAPPERDLAAEVTEGALFDDLLSDALPPAPPPPSKGKDAAAADDEQDEQPAALPEEPFPPELTTKE